ncbi:hypothetical protein [Schinkia azotoformans]|uniref:hypothetical protein n=1 Tax=Schinkia azotoformans TaxID=1454 RepID=UPI002DB6C42A|nr:hypothetical protein [Schinkia azotoformans]MEC1697752.1 hypothetical protein [Schinkia azotoformans]
MNSDNIEFFYCYTKRMREYFYEKAQIRPITTALNTNSNKMFSLYIKTEQLKNLIEEYEAQKSQ